MLFLKCGLWIKVDGSENEWINIIGLEEYQVPEVEDDYILEDDDVG